MLGKLTGKLLTTHNSDKITSEDSLCIYGSTEILLILRQALCTYIISRYIAMRPICLQAADMYTGRLLIHIHET